MKPTLIKLHQKSQILEIGFADQVFHLPAEYLRVFSPSAEVQGHGPGQQVLQHGKLHVKIKAIQAQGNYALKLVFDDGHDSGIFTWSYLLDLGQNHNSNWRDYEAQLEKANKSRDPDEGVVNFLG